MRKHDGTTHGEVDCGPRILTTFDKAYRKGLLVTDIHGSGWSHDEFFKAGRLSTNTARLGYGRRAREEDYLNALHSFFAFYLDRLEPKPRQDLENVRKHLHDIMHDGRSTREVARERGVSHEAIVQGRKRAIEQLIDTISPGGGKAGVAQELRWYMRQTGGQHLESFLPVWVRGEIK